MFFDNSQLVDPGNGCAQSGPSMLRRSRWSVARELDDQLD